MERSSKNLRPFTGTSDETLEQQIQEAFSEPLLPFQPSLGNRIEALHSVPTAIASIALTPESFEDAICNVIFLGGDTDTLAAMAGAVSGAYLGVARLPSRLVGLLESTPKGRAYIQQLAGELFAVYQRGRAIVGKAGKA